MTGTSTKGQILTFFSTLSMRDARDAKDFWLKRGYLPMWAAQRFQEFLALRHEKTPLDRPAGH
jgi:hypothetical protein